MPSGPTISLPGFSVRNGACIRPVKNEIASTAQISSIKESCVNPQYIES